MGLSRVFCSTTIWNHQNNGAQPSLWSNSHTHTWLLEKNTDLVAWTSVGKVMSLLFNMLCRSVITFSFKEQTSFNFVTGVTVCSDFEVQEKKICHRFPFPPFCLSWRGGTGYQYLSFFECWVLSQFFHSPLSPSSIGSLVALYFTAIRVVKSAYLKLLIFLPAIFIYLVVHPTQHLAWCI